MVALAWPRRSETTFTGTPSASSRVACVAQVVQPDRQSLLPTVGGIFEQLRELAEYGSGLARSLARAGVMTALRAREAVLKGRLCVGARSSCGRCRRHGLRQGVPVAHEATRTTQSALPQEDALVVAVDPVGLEPL
jgi:hypothetical protein